MKKLDTLTVRSFLPVFIVSLLFFMLILILVDLFANLWRYINNDIPVIDILRVSLYYAPTCISYSLPISLLFSISYTMGSFYSNNELIAVFGSGVPLIRFILPFLIIGLLLSFGGFFFEEHVVRPSFAVKNRLSRELLGRNITFSNTNVTVLSQGDRIIYHTDYYNDNSKTLSGVLVIIRDPEGNFYQCISAEWATWEGSSWLFRRCRVFTWNEEGTYITERFHDSWQQDNLNEQPITFRKNVRDIREMRSTEAREWITSLRKAGLPCRKSLTDYYQRYSFALTPFIVALISSVIGGSFKKNILLMSLISSLSISVIYYVFQMITTLFADNGYITPAAGAWIPVLFFSIAGFWAFRYART